MQMKAKDKDKRFQILVSLMISSQTLYQITYKTMQSLKAYGLTVDHIIETSDQQFANLLFFIKEKINILKKRQIYYVIDMIAILPIVSTD